MTSDATAMYRTARDAFADALPSADLHMRVPACPEWTVHDLLAHQVHQLSGVCDGTFPVSDSLANLVDPDPTERHRAASRQQQWIDQGIAIRRTHTAARLLDEWSGLVENAPASALGALVPDVAVHLFDLFGTIGRRSHRDDPLVVGALRFWADMAARRIRLAGFGSLRLEIDSGPALGPADASVRVGGDAFELLRTITGRRSRSQADTLRREPDGGPALEHLALYGWRESRLEE